MGPSPRHFARLRRADLVRQLKKMQGRAAFRHEEQRRARVVAELHQARLTGIRVAVPVESLEAQLAGLPEGVTVEAGRIEVRFAGAKEAVVRLFALAQALTGDYERFEDLVGRGRRRDERGAGAGRDRASRRGRGRAACGDRRRGAGGRGVVPGVLLLEYFAAAIANARTRAAYGRAVGQFLASCGARGLTLRAIAPLHVAAYIRTHPGSVPTVKQHLAAIRALCDWLVVQQVLPSNLAASVRGPKHVVTKGATPVLTPAETRSLLARIDTGTVLGLRDRALLSVMVYSFARVSAAVGMPRQDYFRQGVRGRLRLREKGGRATTCPRTAEPGRRSRRTSPPAASRTGGRRSSRAWTARGG